MPAFLCGTLPPCWQQAEAVVLWETSTHQHRALEEDQPLTWPCWGSPGSGFTDQSGEIGGSTRGAGAGNSSTPHSLLNQKPLRCKLT